MTSHIRGSSGALARVLAVHRQAITLSSPDIVQAGPDIILLGHILKRTLKRTVANRGEWPCCDAVLMITQGILAGRK